MTSQWLAWADATTRCCHWLQQNVLMNKIQPCLICCKNPARLVQLFYFSFTAVVRTAILIQRY